MPTDSITISMLATIKLITPGVPAYCKIMPIKMLVIAVDSLWIMAFVFLAAWYMLHHTRLGRYIYALGGNEAATRLSGISVNKVKIIVYSLCGMLASLAGIIEVARLSSAQPTAGTGYELDAIAAVVLGGTSLAGGKGRIVGTLIGALILGFLNNGLNLLGVSSYYQMIVKAVVILLAVLVDNKKQ